MTLLFTLGLTSSHEFKTKTQNIFRVTAEYCYSIWQARNDVLFRYKVLSSDTVDRISHVLTSKCNRLYVDSIILPAENLSEMLMPTKFLCPLARCGVSLIFFVCSIRSFL